MSLDRTDAGVDHTGLSEFRTRLLAGGAAPLRLEAWLARWRERGLLNARGRQRPDSTPGLAAIRGLNRLERGGERRRQALNRVAVGAPTGLRSQVPPAWFDRGGTRLERDHLPQTAAGREALAATLGADGRRLLQAVEAATDLPWRQAIPAVKTLQRRWAEPYTDPPGPRRWRAAKALASPAEVIASPDAPDARYRQKRGVTWVGATVHRTATGADGQPHLLTQVLTTPATTPDGVVGPTIHHDLAPRELLPGTHRLDGGSVDAELRVTATTQQQIEVVGPTLGASSRPRRAGPGDALRAFVIAWAAPQAPGPPGHTRVTWTPGPERRGGPVVRRRVETATGRACPARPACTWATDAPRQRTVRPHAPQEAMQAARQRQETAVFTAPEAQRAGIEGPHAPGIRRCGRRRGRDLGLAKTRVQHLLPAVALKVVR